MKALDEYILMILFVSELERVHFPASLRPPSDLFLPQNIRFEVCVRAVIRPLTAMEYWNKNKNKNSILFCNIPVQRDLRSCEATPMTSDALPTELWSLVGSRPSASLFMHQCIWY